jgi:hypothetical protein
MQERIDNEISTVLFPKHPPGQKFRLFWGGVSTGRGLDFPDLLAKYHIREGGYVHG